VFLELYRAMKKSLGKQAWLSIAIYCGVWI